MIENFRKIKKEEARNAAITQYREEIDQNTLTANIVFVKLAENGTIDEVTATEHLSVFSPWVENMSYIVGDLRVYPAEGEDKKLYKCVQAHTSQADWTPDKVQALWTRVGDPTEEWPEWSQPVGASDAYMNGDKVSYQDKHWISIVDNNVWTPGVYGWQEV